MNKLQLSLVLGFMVLCTAGLWSPNAEAQIVAARVSGTTGQTVTGPPAVLRFNTVDFDTHSAISGEGTG